MGLAAGLRAGTMFGSKMKENYDRGKEEDIENSLFKAYSELQQDSQSLDAEGNMITTEAMDFANMSGDEITNSILREVSTAGGKIDDQTYGIAYRMGNMFQEKKDEFSLFKQKEQNLQLRGQNLQNSIFNRNNTNARREEKFELQKKEKWNPSGKKTGKDKKRSLTTYEKDYERYKSDPEYAKWYDKQKSRKSTQSQSIFDNAPEEPVSKKDTETIYLKNKKTGKSEPFKIENGKYVKIK